MRLEARLHEKEDKAARQVNLFWLKFNFHLCFHFLYWYDTTVPCFTVVLPFHGHETDCSIESFRRKNWRKTNSKSKLVSCRKTFVADHLFVNLQFPPLCSTIYDSWKESVNKIILFLRLSLHHFLLLTVELVHYALLEMHLHW